MVRALLPDALRVAVIDSGGHETELPRIDPVGLFAGPVPDGEHPYRLRARYGGGEIELREVRLTGLDGHRLVILAKHGQTPAAYPRDPGARRNRPW